MNAKNLLQSVTAKYAAIETYQDEGAVLIHAHERCSPDEIHFTARYARAGGLFRFEWTTHHPYPPLRHLVTRWVIGFDGDEAYLYKSSHRGEDLKVVEDLDMAVACATGVSSGSAISVYTMLAPQPDFYHTAGGLSEPMHLSESEIDDSSCWVVTGYDSLSKANELWIGKDDLLLRKFVERDESPVFQEEFRRSVRVNEAIERHVFRNRLPTL